MRPQSARWSRARAEHGPLRGIIHGAGILRDRRIEDKTPEQFDEVFATKVAGARALLAAAAEDDLAFLVFFSSVSGRWGRAGQVDYAMANAALDKMAEREAWRRPRCRVLAMDWGPWDGGMVTGPLKEVFRREGVGLLPLEAGAAHLLRELARSPGGAVEVVAGCGLPAPSRPARSGDGRMAAAPVAGLRFAFERVLDVDRNAFLRSHVLMGEPVLPLAIMLEWLAHGALHVNPGFLFHGIDGLRVLEGVRLAGGRPLPISVAAAKAARGERPSVAVELRGPEDVLHARAEVLLRSSLPPAEAPILPPAAWMAEPIRSSWLADPLALDAAFQAMALWTHAEQGELSLPVHVTRYRQYAARFPTAGVRVLIRARPGTGRIVRAEMDFLDPAGGLVARVEGYECVMAPSLAEAFRRRSIEVPAAS